MDYSRPFEHSAIIDVVGELLFVKRNGFVEDFPAVFRSTYNGVEFYRVPQGLLLLAAIGVFLLRFFVFIFANYLCIIDICCPQGSLS